MRFRFLAGLVLSSTILSPAHGQAAPGAQPIASADQLASVMRRLAAAPFDVTALVLAGELSVKLDDLSAAAAFFARADKVQPRNPRVRAGMASILVRGERPGEALRYYQQAESYGLEPRWFAADRGLAHDLLGEQERAQRDYRLALRTAPDDETVRRYALSLGIAGKQADALEQLEPLTRRQDRAAWRVRAFVLAMGGDVTAARRIATTMMPPGMAAGLQPFFERLPGLPAADRAFAVHFGEVRPTPARMADLRFKPILPQLGPDPYAPVVRLAAVQSAPPESASVRRARERDERRQARDRRRDRDRGVQVAAIAPIAPRSTGSVPVSARPGLAQAIRPVPQPGFGGPPTQVAARPITVAPTQSIAARPFPVESAPVRVASVPVRVAPAPAPAPAPIQVASAPVRTAAVAPGLVASAASITPNPSVTPSAAFVSPPVAASATSRSLAPPVQVASVAPNVPAPSSSATGPGVVVPGFSTVSASPNVSVAPTSAGVAPNGSSVAVTGVLPSSAPSVEAGAALAAVAPIAPVAAPASPGADPRSAAPGFASLAGTPGVAPSPVTASADLGAAIPAPVAVAPTAVAAAPPTATAVRSEDSILARIVASITIPGEELGVVSPARPATVPAAIAAVDPATARVLADAKGKIARETADRAAAMRTVAAAAKAKPVETTRSGTRKSRANRTELADDDASTAPARKGRSGTVELAARDAVRGKSDAKAARDAKPRTAAERKAAGDKASAAKAEPSAKGDPERIWVQVAGGANEGDLSKAWGSARAKAAALKGRDAYTTPLRATNRVVTGPFKTEAEARAFVNQLAKQGVSAFQFKSAKGQKITKLTAR